MDGTGNGDTGVATSLSTAPRPSKPTRRKKSLPRIYILSRDTSLKSERSSYSSAGTPEDISPALSSMSRPRGESRSQAQEQENQTTGDEARRLQNQDGNTALKGQKSVPPPSTMRRDGSSRHYHQEHIRGVNPLAQNPFDHSDQQTWRKAPQDVGRGPLSASLWNKEAPPVREQRRPSDLSSLPPRPHTAGLSKSPSMPQKRNDYMTVPKTRPRKTSDDGATYCTSPRQDRTRWDPPQTATFGHERLRQSLGSSPVSSAPESFPAEGSSVFTKISSTSETTLDLDDVEDYKDDIIDLYCAHSDNGHDSPGMGPVRFPDEDEVRRRSLKIAEAMSEPIDAMLGPSRAPSTEPPTSAQSLPDDPEVPFVQPPPLRKASSSHDQYGFRKASRDISVAQYDAWYTEYYEVQRWRAFRWIAMMQAHGLPTEDPTEFPERSMKVRRFVQKGIPAAWRGAAWFFYAGGDAWLAENPGRYDMLVSQSETPKLGVQDKEAIERDLHRTFPDNVHFKPDGRTSSTEYPPEGPMLTVLRRILRAFAVDHPKVGYCQSLNFIAGFLLLFLPEEKAYWMLHIVVTEILPGTHEMSLEGANIDLWALMVALKDAIPSIWGKIGGEMDANSSRLPPISLCMTSWFMSLFIGNLPTESVLRVWDVLFYEGSKTIFRVALAICKLGEGEIKAVNDPMEIFQVVQTLPRNMIAVGLLMGRACQRGGVTQGWVNRKRAERKEFYANQRAMEKDRKASMDVESRMSQMPRPSEDDAVEPTAGHGPRPGPMRQPTRDKNSNGWWPRKKVSVKR